nr:hypothetical protein [Prevotella sp.]
MGADFFHVESKSWHEMAAARVAIRITNLIRNRTSSCQCGGREILIIGIG